MAIYKNPPVGFWFFVRSLFRKKLYDNQFIYNGRLRSSQWAMHVPNGKHAGYYVLCSDHTDSDGSSLYYCDTEEEAMWKAKSYHQDYGRWSDVPKPTFQLKEYHGKVCHIVPADPEWVAKYGEQK